MRIKNNLIIIAIVLFCFRINAQPFIFGMTSEGGEAFGTIFKTNLNYQNFNSVFSFKGIAGANPIYNTLIEANSGLLYGMNSKGGKYDRGVLFSFNPQTNVYLTIVHFNGTENGAEPRGSLIKTNDGKLWGMTSFGGKNNQGTIFVFDPNTEVFEKKHDLLSINGSAPFGNFCQFNNSLFGMTYQGGANGLGVLFEYNMTNDSFIKKLDFNGSNGQNPFGSLILASNNKMYGITYQGGTFGQGIIFEFNPQNDSFIKKKDFNPTATGSNPYGNLIQAQNGKFYGMAFLGGTNNNGTIFEYDSQNDTLIKKFDFSALLNTGQNPYGNLTEVSSGEFWGTTIQGGTNNGGTLFKYDNNIDSFQVLHRFVSSVNGRNPQGSLAKHSNGKLYGLSNRGGKTNFGVLFEFDVNNNLFANKIDLNTQENGSFPLSNLSEFSKNYYLYGLKSEGGANDDGVLFKMNIENNEVEKIHDFKANTDGANPHGNLTEAPNHKFYGLTLNGGVNNNGALFEYDPMGSVFAKKIDFDNFNLGKNPYSGLCVFNDSILFGMTSAGGLNDFGVIFKYNFLRNSIENVFNFDDTFSGSSPYSSLLLGSDNYLYGNTFNGGKNELGILFKFNPINNVLTKLIDFNGFSNGSYPQSTLVETDNKLYGLTRFGGNNNDGTLFEFDLSNTTLNILAHFHDSIGAQPIGNLLKHSNGDLSGMSYLGGKNGAGTVYEYQFNTQKLEAKHHFNVENGSKPIGGLIKTCIPSRDTINLSVCDSFLFFSGKSTAYQSGIYNDTISTILGCDSLINIHLTIKKSSKSTINASVCNTYIDPLGRQLDSTGTYEIRIPNHAGCDSVISIHLKVKKSFSQLNYTACDTFLAPNGTKYTQNGNYSVVIPNHLNCDSTIFFSLKIQKSYNTITVQSCFNYTLPNGKIIDSTGIYQAIVPNYLNCDSIITIDATITKPNILVTYNDTILVSQAQNSSYQWINCQNNSWVANETNKTFKPQINGNYAVIITQNSCTDTSNCINVSHLNITNLEQSSLSIFPNPTQGLFTLNFNKMQFNQAVLIDLSGKELSNFNFFDTQLIDIRHLKNGIYFLKLTNGSTSRFIKISKVD